MDKTALLLTGTVNPKDMAFTKLVNVESRKSQYLEAIRFWLKTAKMPIVFVENSGYDLSSFFQAEIENDSLELLNFEGNDYPRHLGKGYGELLCLEHAYAFSRFVGTADFIFKATGRHKVLNFDAHHKQFLQDTDIDLLVDFFRFLDFCDSRFFGFRPSFIPEYLLKFKEVVNDSEYIFFENILARAALQAISKGTVFRPLRNFPRIEGTSATLGVRYNASYLYWLKNSMLHFAKYFSFKSYH